jgi:hypothetical protein
MRAGADKDNPPPAPAEADLGMEGFFFFRVKREKARFSEGLAMAS